MSDVNPVALFLAAVPLDTIAEKCGFRTPGEAQEAIAASLQNAVSGPDLTRDAQVARLDRLYQVAYTKALADKDMGAIDRCLSIARQRAAYLGESQTGARLLEQLEITIAEIEGVDAEGIDAGLVEAARAIARNIDFQVNYGTGMEATKALYLLPHLVNLLREMGATPAARGQVKAAAPSPADNQNNKVTQLEAFRKAVYEGA